MNGSIFAVVGYGPGLGAALASRFAREGYAVRAISRDPGKHAALLDALRAEGARVEARAADAGDPASLASALEGDVSVLAFNAYAATMAEPGPSALAPEALMADLSVNAGGALAAARAVLPGMLSAGRGTILLTGGGLALDPTGWLPAASLAAGKSALRSLALTLNRELAPRGVRVGTVTVAGMIKPGTAFDPERIADTFWAMHGQPAATGAAEVVFRG